MSAPRPTSLWARVAGGTLNYGLGRVLPKVLGFVLIPLYAAYLRPEDYGVLDLVAQFGDALFVLMRLGFPGAVTRFYFEHGEGPQLRRFLSTLTRFQALTSAAVASLTLAAWPLVRWKLLPGVPLWPLGLVIVGTVLLMGLPDVQRRVLQVREQSGRSARLSVTMTVVQLALSLALVAGFGMGLTGMLVATLASGIVAWVVARRYLAPDLGGPFDRAVLRESSVYARGIFPSQLIAQAAPLGNRALLAEVASLASLGQLAIANRFASPLSILIGAFSSAYLPIYFSLRKESTPEAHARIAHVSAIAWSGVVTVTLGIVMIGPPLIVLALPERFHPATALLPAVVAGSLAEFIYVLASPELHYAKKSWVVPLVSLVTAVVSIGLAALWVPRFGAAGVVWANVVALLASSLVGAFFARRLVSVPFQWGRMLSTLAAAVALASVSLETRAWSPIGVLALHAAVMVAWFLGLALTGDPAMAAVAGKLGLGPARRARPR